MEHGLRENAEAFASHTTVVRDPAWIRSTTPSVSFTSINDDEVPDCVRAFAPLNQRSPERRFPMEIAAGKRACSSQAPNSSGGAGPVSFRAATNPEAIEAVMPLSVFSARGGP
jgi:hypothetical protein